MTTQTNAFHLSQCHPYVIVRLMADCTLTTVELAKWLRSVKYMGIIDAMKTAAMLKAGEEWKLDRDLVFYGLRKGPVIIYDPAEINQKAAEVERQRIWQLLEAGGRLVTQQLLLSSANISSMGAFRSAP